MLYQSDYPLRAAQQLGELPVNGGKMIQHNPASSSAPKRLGSESPDAADVRFPPAAPILVACPDYGFLDWLSDKP